MDMQEKTELQDGTPGIADRIKYSSDRGSDKSCAAETMTAGRKSTDEHQVSIKTEELEELLIRLVKVRSVVSSSGENDIIDFIEDYLRGWKYFRIHPEQIMRIQSERDPLGRSSLLVCVSGQESKNTVVLLGHTDTVEVDDYGPLADLATTPDRLKDALKSGQRNLYPQAQIDLESDNYLWGRGALDMKVGVANELLLLKQLAENPAGFQGHAIALFVCDEEGNSAGMISAIEVLKQWRDVKKLEICGVINTDYHTAQYPGDEAYCLFRGTVGKIMPIFYIRTLETHAGDPFAGLDANLVLAELINEINLNPKYSDVSGNEVSVPPISLKAEDLKNVYSVKTNHEAWTLISVPLFERTPVDVMQKMLKAAGIAAEKSLDRYYRYQREYAGRAGIPTEIIHPEFEIISLAELIDRVAIQLGQEKEYLIDHYLAPLPANADTREQTLYLIRQLEILLPDRRPRIVVGYAPPFYPAISCLDSDDNFYRMVDRGIKAALNLPEGVGHAAGGSYLLDNGKELKVKTYYPYISDLSYLALPYTADELQIMQNNMPTLGRSYRVPLQTMKALDLPVINLGGYGFDAHKWTERVERDYSLRILPELLASIVMEILGI